MPAPLKHTPETGPGAPAQGHTRGLAARRLMCRPGQKSALEPPPRTPKLNWMQYPEHLDGLLKKLELSRQQQCRGSAPQQLLTGIDELRQALYSRALFLNMLRYRMDVHYIAEDYYIDPPPPPKVPDPATPATGDLKAAVKPVPKKGGKPTSAGEPERAHPGATDDAPPWPVDWDRFMRTPMGETQAREIAGAAAAAAGPVIARYYAGPASTRAITRPGNSSMTTIPATEGECKKRVEERCQALLGAYMQHQEDVCKVCAYERGRGGGGVQDCKGLWLMLGTWGRGRRNHAEQSRGRGIEVRDFPQILNFPQFILNFPFIAFVSQLLLVCPSCVPVGAFCCHPKNEDEMVCSSCATPVSHQSKTFVQSHMEGRLFNCDASGPRCTKQRKRANCIVPCP